MEKKAKEIIDLGALLSEDPTKFYTQAAVHLKHDRNSSSHVQYGGNPW